MKLLQQLVGFVFVIIPCVTLIMTSSTFVALSSVVALGPNAFCAALSDLTRTQRRLCQKKPTVISAVSRGAAMARDECNYQFRNSRWNCKHKKKGGMFGTSLKIASKETAFDCAIAAAGILHSVVTDCANGEISGCECANMGNQRNHRIRRRQNPKQKGGEGVKREVVSKWQWGGCSVDLTFGLQYTTAFTTAEGSRQSADVLMNRHNYEAGRRVVKNNLKMMCRCHGISGACTLHTCWYALPEFREVGDILKAKFDQAVHVAPMYIKESSSDIPRAIVVRSKRQSGKPNKDSLVYIEKSPNFCRKNKTVGSLGTKGRQCNATSTGNDGCGKLCCGRGHKVKEHVITEKCNCRFFWCCNVTCEECQKNVKIYTCK